MNIPRHKSRYSDLPPVDISNESFQRLAFKPRKKEGVKGKGGRKIAASKETTEAPSIVELYLYNESVEGGLALYWALILDPAWVCN